MTDTEFYQQGLGLTTPWKVTDVRLDAESTEIHVRVEHPEGRRWNYPHCSRELACYDHTPEQQWRHLNTCQFYTLAHARGLARKQATAIARIGVDEKAFRTGHRYLTIINDVDCSRYIGNFKNASYIYCGGLRFYQ